MYRFQCCCFNWSHSPRPLLHAKSVLFVCVSTWKKREVEIQLDDSSEEEDISVWSVSPRVVSCVLLFVTPWTVARQAPLPMGFSRQQYWSGLLFPTPGIFLTQRSNPHLLHWQVYFYYCTTWEALKQRQRRQMISLLFTHHYSSFMISYCVGYFIS